MSVAQNVIILPADQPTSTSRRGTRQTAGSRLLRGVLIAVDTLAVLGAWTLAFLVDPPSAHWSASLLIGAFAAHVAGSLALIASHELYLSRVSSSREVEAARLLKVSGSAAVGALALGGLLDSGSSVRAGAGALLLFVFLTIGRGIYDAWLRAERAVGRYTRDVVLVGRNGEAGEVIDLLGNHPELGYRVAGLIGDEIAAALHGVPWLGPPEVAGEAVRASGVSGVLVTTAGMSSGEVNQVTRELLDMGVRVQVSSGVRGIDQRRLRASPLAHEPFFYLESAVLSRPQLLVKRAVDVVGAAAVLLVSSPLLLAAAIGIKLDDRGPVLFRQTRVGRDGRRFVLLKLRTMRPNAEHRLIDLVDANERGGPLFKVDADPRVTRLGRLLRATSIDELPQLFNVLAGSMSLVGPRPALPEEVEQFDADLHARHKVPPGVTGLWQLEARDNPSFYAYRHLDLFYVENWSCALDLVILAGTVPAVMVRSLRTLARRVIEPREH